MQKSLLKKRTRALIPPQAYSLPHHITRVKAVSNRRLRDSDPNACHNLSAVVYNIGLQDTGTCHRCPKPAILADVQHLLSCCPGTKTSRDLLLRAWAQPSTSRWPREVDRRQLAVQDPPGIPAKKQPTQRPPTPCATQNTYLTCWVAKTTDKKKVT